MYSVWSQLRGTRSRHYCGVGGGCGPATGKKLGIAKPTLGIFKQVAERQAAAEMGLELKGSLHQAELFDRRRRSPDRRLRSPGRRSPDRRRRSPEAIENAKAMLAARTMGAGPLGQLPGGSIAPAAAAPTPAYDGKFRAAKAAFKAYVVYFNAHPEARERLGVRPHADYEGKADAAAAVRATRAEARAALNTLTGMWKTLEVSAPPAQLLKALHAMKELHQDGHLNCQDPAMGGEDTAEGRLWGVYRKAAQDLRIDMQVQVPVPAQTLSLAAAEQLELVRIASLSPANGDAAAPSSSGAPSCSQLELVAVYPNLSEEDPILLTKDDLVRESRGFEP